jgi:ATPase subunit of ABC transporter with duplicated ATPase domains
VPSLRLHGASFAFPGERALLRDVDLHLVPGWTGVVGANGVGKSTLLQILSGELAPGLARRSPPDLRVVRLDQRLDAPEPRLYEFADAWDADAARWRSVLALDPDALIRWATLSPGERRRWQVAAALWEAPDALLLDEPDNHLDAAARDAVRDALASFGGIGVLVSHDRDALDALTTRTARLRDGRIDVVDGPWSHAAAVWAAESASRQHALDAASDARRAAARRLHAARETHAASDRSRSFRDVGTHDHDARSSARKHRAQTGEAAHARQLARANHAYERTIDALDAAPRPEDLGRPVVFDAQVAGKARWLAWTDRTIVVGDRPLLTGVSLTVERQDRVWIRGPNGAGKTTLLRALLADVGPENALWLPQELDADAVSAVLRSLRTLPPDARGRALQLVAALGVDPSHLLATPSPSPGEARKLALALGLTRGVGLVALDEPDHHLDLPSRERLEAALRAFPGAILLVTHDAALARAVTTATWTVGGGRVAGP